VSFAHGSNDGQKGMGLIMLILIGTVPTAYALNRAVPARDMAPFIQMASETQQALEQAAPGTPPADARGVLSTYVRTHAWNADVLPALAAITGSIAGQVRAGGTFAQMRGENVTNVRNDMYLTSEAIRSYAKDPHAKDLSEATRKELDGFKKQIDGATKFIPLWVKVAVAIALGLGTMVGWKRIVVTIGEKIGKTHLTYAQGAAAELVAMVTIGAADMFGLPVSTTHVLSSGVAGTMAANHSGLQMRTLRNLLMAWVLTLPAAILLSGALYWVFRQIF
jgi:PiT family inorganic phosphate transporter